MINHALSHAQPPPAGRTRRMLTAGACGSVLAAGLAAGLTLAPPAGAAGTGASAAPVQHDPIGHLKHSARSGHDRTGHSVRAAGFARDYDSTAPVRVTISVDGRRVKTVRADRRRAANGHHTAFRTKVHVGGGRHRVCASAGNRGDGKDQKIGCFTVRPVWKIENKAISTLAAQYVGYRYVSGGSSPQTGFDCSGFTSYVYRTAARLNLAHSAETQSEDAHSLSSSAVHKGDLVFFHSGSHVYHVAIYAGHGTIWAAATTRDGVLHQRIWTSAVTYGSYTHH